MDDGNRVKIDIAIPFPSNREAEIAYHVLRVDVEPKRNGVFKELSLENNILLAKFSADLARQLRVAVNGFFDNISLLSETIEFAGAPTSVSYSHF